MNALTSLDDALRQASQDDDFRAEWERTVLARSIANQIVKYRADHGLSQRALAAKLGVSQAVVGRLELGEHEPKLSTLSRLSRVLGMRFDIAVHPVDRNVAPERDEVSVSRFESDGVELIVAAG